MIFFPYLQIYRNYGQGRLVYVENYSMIWWVACRWFHFRYNIFVECYASNLIRILTSHYGFSKSSRGYLRLNFCSFSFIHFEIRTNDQTRRSIRVRTSSIFDYECWNFSFEDGLNFTNAIQRLFTITLKLLNETPYGTYYFIFMQAFEFTYRSRVIRNNYSIDEQNYQWQYDRCLGWFRWTVYSFISH